MLFTSSKRWELIGVTSFGWGCANAKFGSIYTRVTAFRGFIERITNNISKTSIAATCSCQCHRGSNQGFAYTTETSSQSCVNACKAVPENPCVATNTYACPGINCVYSTSNSIPIKTTVYDTHTYSNGDRYERQFLDSKRGGNGTHYFASGEKYTGEWMNDSMNGQGILTWSNDNRYVGQFQGGRRSGKGTHYFASGNNYTGEWMNDSMNGQGVYTWPNGNRYVTTHSQICRHHIQHTN
jgi:hypothetical protein